MGIESMAGIVLLVAMFGLLLWGIQQALAWIVAALLALGGGIASAAYGISLASMAAEPRAADAAERIAMFIGGGIGAAVAGLLLLIVAMIRMGRDRRERRLKLDPPAPRTVDAPRLATT